MSLPFHFPPGQNYVCVRCGKSCEMFDEVPLDEESRRRLEAVPYRDLLPAELREKPVVLPSPSGAELPTLAKSCGACVFLTADRLCGLHSRFGAEAKPLTCHEFPFRYVETANGVFVGLSFACTAVLQNAGPPVGEQAAELEAGFAKSKMILRRQDPVRLTNRHEISWDAYQLLEEDLQAIIGTTSEPIGLRLAAQATYLDLLVALLRQVRGDAPLAGEPATTTAPFRADLRGSDADVVLSVRRKFLSDDAEPIFRLAARAKGSPALHRAFIGLVTAFRQNLQVGARRPGRLRSAASIFRHYVQHSMKLGRVRLSSLEKPFDYGAFATVEEDWSGDREELLRRYFSHMLFRKDLLLGENVWLAQRMMLMQFALIRWHAVGAAAIATRNIVGLEDLRESIATVERQYGFHASFAKLFQDTPMLGVMLDGIVKRPTYAGAMTGAVV